MKKGFSITIKPQNVAVNSFIAKENDDIDVETARVHILLEGVLLNKQQLLNAFAVKDFETLIQELYFQKKEAFIQLLVGEFRGFIYDKEEQKLIVFTNITSTQRVYYGKFGDTVVIDTSLIRLSETLKKNDIGAEPDLESLYQLLCFTNLPEGKTPVQHIHKVLDGHFLNINLEEVSLNEVEYFNLSENARFSGNKNAAIDQIHEIFQESVLLEYDKDTEYGTHHLSLLSGGLDSRVAMMYAFKNNRKPGNVLCFSQSNYFDQTISEKIAEDFDIHYEFIPLDGGKFLKEIDKLTEISEGMVLYTGGIHVQHAVKNMQYENFGLFHSGQIGDGVLGGFNTEPRRKKPTSFKIAENLKFLPQVQSSLTGILNKYESEELFLLRNVAYNRTILGAHVFQQKRYQTSPFMTQDFLKFATSLPEEWKFNHRFYIEWISKHCKEATDYRWERTLLKPNAPWKTSFGDQFIKRGFKILNEKVLKTPQNSSMYPYQFYFDQDAQIQRFYQDYYDQNIHRIEEYPDLLKDVQELFQTNDFNLKSKAINILSIFKLYF